MENVPSHLQWVFRLNLQDAQRHLRERNLDTAGIIPVLRSRLYEHLTRSRGSPGIQGSDPSEFRPSGQTELPEGAGPVPNPSRAAPDVRVEPTIENRGPPDSGDPWLGARRSDLPGRVSHLSLPDLRERSLPQDRNAAGPARQEYERIRAEILQDVLEQLRIREPAVYCSVDPDQRPENPFSRRETTVPEPPPAQPPGRPQYIASTPRRGHDTATFSLNSSFNTLHKLNIKFMGKRGEDADAFLLRLSEGRQLMNVSDEDVLRCLPFFFHGIALQWLRSHQSEWLSYRDFEYAFRIRFSDPDFQSTLQEQIYRRTQGENEPVADFLTCLRAMVERAIPRWPTTALLNIAHRNMLPRLQVAVNRDFITDYETLERQAVRVERSYLGAQAFRPPPTPEQSLLPDLAYHHPARNTRRPAHLHAIGENAIETCAAIQKPRNRYPKKRDVPPTNPFMTATAGESRNHTHAAYTDEHRPRCGTEPISDPGGNPFLTEPENLHAVSTTQSPPSNPTCWNCKKTGHRYASCPEKRQTFCFRCGHPNVTKFTCPTCTGNANGSR